MPTFNTGETDQLVIVTNRITGEPVKDASISVRTNRASTPVAFSRKFSTDANGWVKIPVNELPTQTSFQYRIVQGADTILSGQQYHYQYPNRQNEEQAQTYAKLFTDRAIYRPGQPIYVKGLFYEGKSNQFSVLAGREESIEFVDQNGERIAKQTLKTNEFGTFTTSFTAPAGRLTGQMTLQTPFGNAIIRVEEYKRPTFEVTIQPIKQSFKLNQQITLSASAKTFSGAVVDGAEVRYRVVRKLRPRWDWGYDSYSRFRNPQRSGQTEIASGTAQTDALGNVPITFVAQADREQARETNPIFDFEVTIDMTDRAGETRSATKVLHIGYSALQVSLAIPPQVETDSLPPFPIRITNQSGQRVAAQGQLSIYRLQSPNRILRARLWPHPDR